MTYHKGQAIVYCLREFPQGSSRLRGHAGGEEWNAVLRSDMELVPPPLLHRLEHLEDGVVARGPVADGRGEKVAKLPVHDHELDGQIIIDAVCR